MFAKKKNNKKLQQVLMITSFVCVVVGGPSQGIFYTHIHTYPIFSVAM
jgi:hypothetical protein